MDFPTAEYEARLEAAHRAMAAAKLDALFFTTEPEVRYFTGFRTRFWESPTRPWFVIVPADAKPIAVIPEIGAATMARTWVDDIRTWPAPAATDDGVSALAGALAPFRRVGIPMGRESQLRMPLADFEAVRKMAPAVSFEDATGLVQALRMTKSPAEIEKIAAICAITSRAFAHAPALFHTGQPLDEAFRAFKIELLRQGAEDVPYLVGGAGPDGYEDVISPPSATPIRPGDVLMLDTGAQRHGYFADFDRNFSFGEPNDAVRRAHETLWLATEAGLAAARPGTTARDVFEAMAKVVDQPTSAVGRMGHGLGMQLTEPPSLIPHDDTMLRSGMVLTLEPSMTVTGDTILVHEENIVVQSGPPRLLTERAPREMVRI